MNSILTIRVFTFPVYRAVLLVINVFNVNKYLFRKWTMIFPPINSIHGPWCGECVFLSSFLSYSFHELAT